MNEIKIECPNCKTEVDVGKIIEEKTKDLYKQLATKSKVEKENEKLIKHIKKQDDLSTIKEAKIKEQAKLQAEKNNSLVIAKIKQQAKLEADSEVQESKDKVNKEQSI